MKGVYCDAFVMHDETDDDPAEKEEEDEIKAQEGSQVELERGKKLEDKTEENLNDARQRLNQTWSKVYKFQPLWQVRNYFGEKIALYFAWSGTLITSLWLPAIFGFVVFIYGLIIR